MTAVQIVVMACAYAVALAAAIYFTRAPRPRIAAAAAGGAAAGLLGVGAIVLGESLGVWQVFVPPTAGMWALFYIGLSISLAPIYLVTWRIVRRFHWPGLAVCLAVVAVIGPPRDYFYASVFPAWMVFARGVAPVLADAGTYVAIVALGHAVMRLTGGPDRGSLLAR